MNLTALAIENRAVTYFAVFLLLAAGIASYLTSVNSKIPSSQLKLQQSPQLIREQALKKLNLKLLTASNWRCRS